MTSVKTKWYIQFEEGYAVITDGSEEISWTSLAASAEKRNILIAISDAFSNIKDIKINLKNAQYALRYSIINGTVTGIAKFDDYKFSHLISTAGDYLDLTLFTSNYIHEIEQYDIKNNSEYLNTLRAFIKYNRNTDEMSKALFIHKNTVFYRLKRLEEIFGIDLHNVYQISSLVCSLIIYDNNI